MPRNGSWRRFRITVFLVVWLPVILAGQMDYHEVQYTSVDGLPQNSIRDMALDAHGFLWLATEGGIVRFDGRTFRVVGDEDAPGIHNRRFSHALRYSDSTILFVDQLSGLFDLSNGRFRSLRMPGGLNPDIIGLNGGIPDPRLFLTDTLFLRCMSQAFHVVTPLGIGVFPVTPDSLVIVGRDIHRYDRRKGHLQRLRSGFYNGFAFGMLGHAVVHIDSQGMLKQLDPVTGVLRALEVYDSQGARRISPLPARHVLSRYPYRSVFLIAQDSLFRLRYVPDAGRYVLDCLLDRLPRNCGITSVEVIERDGIILIGTDSRGLFVYRRTFFRTLSLDAPGGDESNVIYAQALLDSSSLLTSTGAIVDLRTNLVTGRFPLPLYKYHMARDGEDGLLFIHPSDGHFIYRGRQRQAAWTFERLAGGARANYVDYLGGRTWLASVWGVGYVQGDRVRWMCEHPFGHKRAITRMNFGPDGRLWLASVVQLYALDTLTGALDSLPRLENAECRALDQVDGKLFVGTYGHGSFVYTGGRFVELPGARQGLLSHVHAFMADQAGYLWMTTNRGLVRTHLAAVDRFLQDTTQGIPYFVYREPDGIRNAEFNGGCTPAYLRLPDGRFSLPSIEGLVMFDPRTIPVGFTPDPVVIERMDIDGELLMPFERQRISPGHKSIGFHFAVPWWGLPENLQVEYRLEGQDDRFQRVRPAQSVCTFGHLKPGTYRLVFRKRTGFGAEEYVYSRFVFTVGTPWYATTWAFLGYAAAIVLLVWGASSWRARAIRQRNIRLSKMVEEQTAALRRNIRVRDRLMSIITHDILTPLRFIGLIAKLGGDAKPDSSPGQAAQALADVRNAIGKLFHSTQNMLNWVKYHREGFRPVMTRCAPLVIVDQLVQDFSEMIHFQGNEVVNAVPEDDIIRTDAQLLQVILHNLLSNAIKFTTSGKIVIRSASTPEGYMLEVQDTGRGMTKEQLVAVRAGALTRLDTPIDDLAAGTGIGLSLVAELVSALGGQWTIDGAPGRGVVVRIFLPEGDSREGG